MGEYCPFSTAFLGLPQIIRPDGLYHSQKRFGMYRWHIMDPIRFERDLKVTIAVEEVWNKFLLSPLEMRQFVDAVGSPYVQVYFDVGNQLAVGFPEQWIRILGSRVRRIHLKDFRIAIGNINGFVTLLEGNVNCSDTMRAVREVGYNGYLTAEYGPYAHGPDVLLQHLSASMDRIIALAEA